MPNTSIYAIPYQSDDDEPDGAALGQGIAERVEAILSDGTKSLSIAALTTAGTVTVGGDLSVGDDLTVTDSLTVAGDVLCGSENGINSPAASSPNSDTTTSGSYVNMAGTGSVTSFSFTKRYAATRIKVEMSLTFVTNNTGSGGQFGVRINGVDTDVCRLAALLSPNVHLPCSGPAYISGVPAGTYTVQGRWYRIGGSGTLSRDFNDFLAITAREVA